MILKKIENLNEKIKEISKGFFMNDEFIILRNCLIEEIDKDNIFELESELIK